MVPGPLDSAFPARGEQAKYAAARHVAFRGQSGRLENRRGKVHLTDEVADDPTAREPFRPSNGQGNPRTVVVEVGLGAGKRHSVVARDYDHRAVQLPPSFQEGQDLGQLAVEPTDLKVVVQDVASNLRDVGKKGGNSDVLQTQPAGEA